MPETVTQHAYEGHEFRDAADVFARDPEPAPEQVRVLRGRVLITTVPPATKVGMIYVPEVAQRTNAAEGVVGAIGPDVDDVAIGDRVLFEPMAMTEVTSMHRPDGSRTVVIPAANVLAVSESAQ